MISEDGVSKGMDKDHPDYVAQFALGKHGDSSRDKAYNGAKEQAVAKTSFGKAHAGLLQSARHKGKVCSSETSPQSSDSSSTSKTSMPGSKRKVDGVGGKANRVQVKAEVELCVDDEEARVLLGQMRDLAKEVIDEIVPTKNGMEPTHPKYGEMATGTLELACKRKNGRVRILYEDRLIPLFKARDQELTTKFYGAFPTFECSRGRFGKDWPDWWTRYDRAKSVGAKSSGTESSGTESSGTESSGAKSSGTESSGAKSSGTESEGAESVGAESEGAESVGAESVDTSPG